VEETDSLEEGVIHGEGTWGTFFTFQVILSSYYDSTFRNKERSGALPLS
jgi:hypothetical protein